MTPEEAAKFLAEGTNAPVTLGEIPTSMQSSQQQFSMPGQLSQRIKRPIADEEFRAANEQPGVPLDTESGLGAWDSLMMELRQNEENRIRWLENKWGKGSVRKADNGELIVRVPDPTEKGKVKDVLTNPRSTKMTADDFMFWLATMPEMAGSVLLQGYAGTLPVLQKTAFRRFLKSVGSQAIGAEAAGLAKDITASAIDFGDPSHGLNENIRKRFAMGGVDLGIGAVGALPGPIAQFMKNPLHPYRRMVQFATEDANRAIGRDLKALMEAENRRWPGTYSPLEIAEAEGKAVDLSAGQATGAPLLARSEVFVEKLPGGSGPIRSLWAEQESRLRRLMEIFLGKNPPTDEELGRKMIQNLGQYVGAAKAGVETARERLGGAAANAIEQDISALTAPARELHREVTGEAVRKGVFARYDAAKAISNGKYAAVKAHPGGSGIVFDGTGLQNDLGRILGELPAVEHDVTKGLTGPGGPIVGPTGAPLTVTVPEQKLLKAEVPSDIIPRLREILSLQNPRFSLDSLRQMRTDVYNAMGGRVPVGTQQKHYLKEIADAIDNAIDTGAAALPSGSTLKPLLQDAQQFYKKEIVPFSRMGVGDLWNDASHPHFVTDSEIIDRLTKDVNNWKVMKETLGAGSPEWTRVRRSVADNILRYSQIVGTGDKLDIKRTIANLYHLREAERTIYDDIFAPKERELFRQARFLNYAEGDKVDKRELAALLASPDPNAAKLQQLIAKERRLDRIESNQILKAAGDGTLNSQTVPPSQWVERIIHNPNIGASEVERVMRILRMKDPITARDYARKTVESVFAKSMRPATAEDVMLILDNKPSRMISGKLIGNMLSNRDFRLKLTAAVGPDRMKILENFVRLQVGLSVPEESFAGAGGIAAGVQIARIEQGKIMNFVDNVARSFIFSWIITSDAGLKWLTHVPGNQTELTKGLFRLIGNPEFLRDVHREFGEVESKVFMHNLSEQLGRGMEAEAKFQNQQRRQSGPVIGKWDAFLATGTNAPSARPAGQIQPNEEIRAVKGRPAVFDKNSHVFVRWLNE